MHTTVGSDGPSESDRSASRKQSTKSGGTGEFWVDGAIVDVDWKLHSMPEAIFVKSQMMLSTPLGECLQTHRCFELCLGASIVLQLLLSMLGPVDPFSWTSQWKLVSMPRPICILSHVVVAAWLAFLLLHRCNRDIFLNVIRSSNSAILFCLLFLAHLTWVLASVQEGSQGWIQTIVEHTILIVFRIPLLIMACTTDSLFTTRRSRIAIVLIPCACALFAWVDARCVSESWGVQPICAIFDVDGFSARELCLHGLSQSFPLALGGLLRFVFGSHFLYVCPKYSPRACGPLDDAGVWYSCVPSSVTVKRRMVLSTPIGNFLERRCLMNKALVVSCLMVFFFYSAHSLIFYWISKDGDRTVVKVKPGREIIFACSAISLWFANFLALHRMNRQVWIMCLKRFEVLMIMVSLGTTVFTMHWYILTTFGDDQWPLRLLFLLAQVVLVAIATSLDGLRFTRRVRLTIYTLTVVGSAYNWMLERCLTARWKMETKCSDFLSGKHAGISPREVYLNLMFGALMLFTRALYMHLSGRNFSVWSPSYVPNSCLFPKKDIGSGDNTRLEHVDHHHPEGNNQLSHSNGQDINDIKVGSSQNGTMDFSRTLHANEFDPCQSLDVYHEVEQPKASEDCNLLKLSL